MSHSVARRSTLLQRAATSAATAVLILGFTAVTDTAAAAPGEARACPIDYQASGHIRGVDWLRVHTAPKASAPSVGQLKRGAHVCYQPTGDNGGWVKGYGYNGSTRVFGWMVSGYIGP